MANFWPFSFCFWFIFGHVLTIYGQGEHPVLIFSSMRATGRRAGGSAGGCRAHRRKKTKNEHPVSKIEHPVLIFRPYIPGTRPALAGAGRHSGSFEPNRSDLTPLTRAGGQDDGS